MAGTTGNRGYTFPTLGDANDVPYYIQTLAEALDIDIAALNNPAPITPTYQSGWGDHPAGTFQGLLATRSSGGLIGLSGIVYRTGTTIAATTAGQHVATLPVGYRPPKEIRVYQSGQYATGGNFELGIIQILPTGEINLGWTVARAWTSGQAFMSLAGVSYVAA